MASNDISKGKMEPKTKASSSRSSIVPPRKYGAHSGLKFKFNTEKESVSKSVIVESLTERKLSPQKDKGHSEPKLNLNLLRDIIRKESNFEIQSEKAKLPPRADEAHSEPKITNLLKDTINKSTTFESKEKEKLPPRKYGAHSGLKFEFEKGVIPKSPTFKSRTEKEKGNVMTGGTVTKRIVQNQTQKEVHTTSGERKYVSTLEDVKISRVRASAASLRDLQPQQQSSKSPNSHACNTLKSREMTSNVSNLSPLNIRKISKGGPPLTEESMITTPRKKYGFHAGLRFCHKKDATPVDTVFNRSPTLPKNNCFESEKRDPVS